MSNEPHETRGDVGLSDAILAAFRAFLRPIARLMIQRQITFGTVAELLKQVLIKVAREEFPIEGRRETDSRLSLLTGINRKDVKRLRLDQDDDLTSSPAASLGALLISRWTGDPIFLDDSGLPLDLPRVTAEGSGPSFELLVFSASKDIPVRSVLDEWIRLGIVSLDERDIVRLKVDSFVPEDDVVDKTYFFGRNLRDHAAAGVHNLLGSGDPLFDRSVFYDRLSEESVAELREAAAQIGARSIAEVNRLAHQLQARDAERSPEDATRRMTWGAFFFHEDEGRADTPPDEPSEGGEE